METEVLITIIAGSFNLMGVIITAILYYLAETKKQKFNITEGGAVCFTYKQKQYANLSLDIPKNIWTHIAIVANSSNKKLISYMNGEYKSHINTPLLSVRNNYPLIIGRHYVEKDGTACCHYYFKGKIDNLKIFAKPLSEREITSLYKE